jgi:hypothetical protein
MKHFMVDLETLGLNPNAAIVSIGGVLWDYETDEEDYFYEVITAESNTECGFDFNLDTLAWWSKQSAEARKIFFSDDRVHIHTALTNLKNFLEMNANPQYLMVWGNGAVFDNAKLENAFDKFEDLETPWHFTRSLCYRTLRLTFPQFDIRPPKKIGTHHNALDDAKFQMYSFKNMVKNIDALH